MADNSPRLGLPYILPAQAQKHVTHNEALAILDALTQLVLEEVDASTPPSLPAEGGVWALGPAPSAAWASEAGKLAQWTGSGWLFMAPQEGWQAWDRAAGVQRIFRAGSWQVVAIENVTGIGIGTTSDATNRLAVASDAVLFSHESDDIRLKLNKAGAGDTSSLLFQSGWTGHGEIGLTGDTALHVKVSPDGTNWVEALRVDPATGTLDGAAIQTDEGDRTEGRLLRMGNERGPFNLGSKRPVALSGSLDDLLTDQPTSFFAWSAAATQTPWSEGVGLQILSWDTTGSQIGLSHGSNPRLAFRSTSSATPDFSDWREVFHGGNVIGPIAASGQPGAIIEKGSNANGNYIRFADGTQMCWMTDLLNAIVNAGTTGSLTWVFPVAFVNNSSFVSCTFGSNPNETDMQYAAAHFGASARSAVNMLSMIGYANTGPSNTRMRVNAFATGRWY